MPAGQHAGMQTKVVKRKTVNGTTFRIEKEKGKQNYFLTADRKVFDSHRTKREAEDYFREAIEAEDAGDSSGGGGGMGFDLGFGGGMGGGGPTVPGFGMESDDDDDGPRLPGF